MISCLINKFCSSKFNKWVYGAEHKLNPEKRLEESLKNRNKQSFAFSVCVSMRTEIKGESRKKKYNGKISSVGLPM